MWKNEIGRKKNMLHNKKIPGFTITEYKGHSYVTEVAEQNMDKIDQASEDETKQATETLEKMNVQEYPQDNDVFLTQKDIASTSFEIDTDYRTSTAEKSASVTSQKNVINNIDEVLRRRHHILTLKFTMLNGPKIPNQTPKFLRTNLEFHPYFGSPRTKSFFVDRVKSVKRELDEAITNKLIEACDEFTKNCTDEANN